MYIKYISILNQASVGQSSYLSQISQIIFVEKKLLCGEILGKIGKFRENFGNLRNFKRFCHNFKRFHVEKN